MKRNILIILLFIVVYNIIVFCVYGYDKHCAIKNKWRVSEKVLILSALLFGALGAFLGMQLFRHKTKHIKFQILIPIFLICQIIAFGFISKII